MLGHLSSEGRSLGHLSHTWIRGPGVPGLRSHSRWESFYDDQLAPASRSGLGNRYQHLHRITQEQAFWSLASGCSYGPYLELAARSDSGFPSKDADSVAGWETRDRFKTKKQGFRKC